jgi:hypothetical protein
MKRNRTERMRNVMARRGDCETKECYHARKN